MKDRETNPLETAIYWTEYVIRHNGAKHLRVAGLNLPWYKYYLLDVFAVIAVFLVVILYVSYKLFYIFYHKLRSMFGKNVKKVKQN